MRQDRRWGEEKRVTEGAVEGGRSSRAVSSVRRSTYVADSSFRFPSYVHLRTTYKYFGIVNGHTPFPIHLFRSSLFSYVANLYTL